jgi:hypothetical protein
MYLLGKCALAPSVTTYVTGALSARPSDPRLPVSMVCANLGFIDKFSWAARVHLLFPVFRFRRFDIVQLQLAAMVPYPARKSPSPASWHTLTGEVSIRVSKLESIT